MGGIRRLSEDVVNRIAAGEVIHRPVSAVKEMVENSLDAGATSISVRVSGGGMKQFCVQDNGSGVRKEDLSILCERFATSKLQAFEDLLKIGTYGFRGEALASISHVSKVSVTTKTQESPCAFKASYQDGKICGDPKASAGVRGTTIVVEDLFYNMPARKRALKNAAEEYNRILDVLGKYAIHRGLSEEQKSENQAGQKHRGAGFVCRKQTSMTPDLHTTASDSKLDNIRTIFGAAVANEVLFVQEQSEKFQHSEGADVGEDVDKAQEVEEEEEDDESKRLLPGSKWTVEGYVSNANYNRKKSSYIFFINHRLVACPTLKRSLDALYAEYLPKGTGPFVYLSIEMPSHHVDVNVHPNKREVHFLFEDYIVSEISQIVRKRLLGANTSRVFYTQQTINNDCELISSQLSQEESTRKRPREKSPGANFDSFFQGQESQLQDLEDTGGELESEFGSQRSVAMSTVKRKKKYEPHKLVRTDPKACRLDTYFERASQSQNTASPNEVNSTIDASLDNSQDQPICVDDEAGEVQEEGRERYMEAPRGVFNDEESEEARQLSSVKNLVAKFEKRKNDKLKEMLADLVFVGWVDECFCLVQVHTGLFVVDFVELCKEMFYQLALRNFGSFSRMVLSSPVPLLDVLEMGLDLRAKRKQLSPVDPTKLKATATKYADFLIERADMLEEYFRINIDPKTGLLRSLPEIVTGYTPFFSALAPFLLRLCEQVEWYDEEGCFDTVAMELGNFYAQFPPFPQENQEGWVHDKEDPRYVIKNVLFPCLRKQLVPYAEHADPNAGVFTRIAALENLYRIFERC